MCCVLCSTYLDRLAEELNDKLQEAGLISIAELCKNYDLPGDFLSEVSHSQPLMTKNQSVNCVSFVFRGSIPLLVFAGHIYDRCVFPVSGVVKATWEAYPRRNGPVQQGSHIYSSVCCSPQSEDTRAFHRHHKVNFMIFRTWGLELA